VRIIPREPELEFGLYQVTGRRAYRGHEPGAMFTARLDRAAAQRAVVRGDITLLQRIVPEIQAESFSFPEGWLPSRNQSTRGAERRLSR
jgi:hypothetical protein